MWRFALTPFRSVVVFISDFFAPFFRKTVNFLFFVSLDKCVTQKRKHACDKKTVNKDTIENQVVKAVMNKIMDDELMEYLADSLYSLQLSEETRIPQLKEELVNTERGINNMLDAIQKGIILDSTKKRLSDLEERKKALEIELVQEQIRKPILTREQILFGITKFRNLDTSTQEGKRTLIESFVNAIYLYDTSAANRVCCKNLISRYNRKLPAIF